MDAKLQIAWAARALDGRVTEQDVYETLANIYQDGYMDNAEEALLQSIADRKNPENQKDPKKTNGVVVDAAAQNLAEKVLAGNAYSAKQFKRFADANKQLFAGYTAPVATNKEASVELLELTSLQKEGFLLKVKMNSEGVTREQIIELPNKEGRYVDGTVAGREDSLSADLFSTLAVKALKKTALAGKTPEKNNLYRLALEACNRMGELPREEVKPMDLDSHPCKFAKTSGEDFFELVGREAELQAKGSLTQIRGFTFSGALSPDTKLTLEKELASYPDYIVAALADVNGEITLFDPATVYTKLIDEGKIIDSPQTCLCWEKPAKDGKKPRIYMDITNMAALVHELFHRLMGQMPAVMVHGISRLFDEAEGRVQHYKEEAFVTTYAGTNYLEYEAEGCINYYKDHWGWYVGTKTEMQDEDPLFFLALLQMDALLENKYGKKQKGPEFYAALSETARARSEAYLKTMKAEHKDWKDPALLKNFRDEALTLDIKTEKTFWQGHEERLESCYLTPEETVRLRTIPDRWAKAPHYVISKSQYEASLHQMAQTLPAHSLIQCLEILHQAKPGQQVNLEITECSLNSSRTGYDSGKRYRVVGMITVVTQEGVQIRAGKNTYYFKKNMPSSFKNFKGFSLNVELLPDEVGE